MAVKCGEMPLATWKPPVTQVVPADKILPMPRVAMNESTCSMTTMNELTSPTSSPKATAAKMPRMKPWWLAWNQTTMQTPMPRVPPIDRSNAPQATGTIRPRATMAVMACDPAMMRKLVAVRNRLGTHSAKMRISTAHTYRPLNRSRPRAVARPRRVCACWPPALGSTSGSRGLCSLTVIPVPFSVHRTWRSRPGSSSAGGSGSRMARSRGVVPITADRGRGDQIVVHAATGDLVGDLPAPQDQHPVAQPDKFLVVGGDDDHGGAVGGGLIDELVDVRLGADVHALGGLVEDEYLGLHPQPAGQHHLLLVSAGQIGHRELAVPRAHVQAVQPHRHVGALPALAQDSVTPVQAGTDHRDVLAQGRRHERGVGVALGRDQSHAQGHRLVRPHLGHRGAVDRDLARPVAAAE